jgi:hypothetical protein
VLARALGLDKVLTSRLLKAARHKDPVAVAYHVPGPEPLRRFFRAARRKGVEAGLTRAAERAVDRFESLVRREIGDRSSLDAMISAWLPEAREEFETRRKQSAYKALSQLKGSSVDTTLASVLLHPSKDGEHIDIVWIVGLLGLRRLRPRATVKVSTRRMSDVPAERRPVTLGGEPVEGLEGLRLDEFCDAPPASLEVRKVGEQTVHYVLAGQDFGPRSAVDVLLAEVNLGEIPRYVPVEKQRKGYVFAEVSTPTRTLLFDVLVHEDVYPDSDPSLYIYDTALEGVADINDRSRDIDRVDMAESIQSLGRGPSPFRAPDIPNYSELIRHVLGRMGWDGEAFRGYRCRIDYPLYGSQVAMAFDPPSGP